ncbi:MAG: hypothetical protein ACRD44_08105 [Bryobacteraceae bacterium]
MQIEYEPVATLPPMSWCARLRAGAPARVRHGEGVETRPGAFVEGAWDGDFDTFDFDRAASLAGTGGRARDGRLVFAGPFHPLERLYVLRAGGETLVSNSLAFVVTEAGDGLDLRHPDYFFDLIAQVRRGIAPPTTRLRTASGNQVELYPCCNLEWQPDTTLRRVPKPLGPPPTCYAEYFALLRGTTERIAANARASGRRRTYRLVAACSRGYDSTAAAALASLAGCREGVTYTRSIGVIAGHPLFGVTARHDDDSGAESLRALGMSVAEFDRSEFDKLPGHPRAEFFLSPPAITDASTRLMEDLVCGSVFVSGRHGERYWGPTRRCAQRNLREPDDCLLAGHALVEFRLRAGFVHFPAPYVGALHAPAIHRITHTPEMRPWKLGTGYYDRPIARRIAEEAGVPRECFGHRKMGAGLGWKDLSPESERDFQDFVRSEVPQAIRRRLDPRHMSERVPVHRKLAYFRTHWAHRPLVSPLMKLIGADRYHFLGNSIYLYQFHWGFEKTRVRYRA